MKKSYKIAALVALVALGLAGGVYRQFSKPAAAPAAPVPVAPVVKTPVVVAPVQVPPVSVEFEQVPLADIVAFISLSSRYHFVFDSVATDLLSWREINLPADRLLGSFFRLLDSRGYSVLQTGTTFHILKNTAVPHPVSLDFAISNRGLFLLYKGVVYPFESMPVPVYSVAGSWFTNSTDLIADTPAVAPAPVSSSRAAVPSPKMIKAL